MEEQTLLSEMQLFVGEEVEVVCGRVSVSGTLLDAVGDYIVVKSGSRMHRLAVAHIHDFVTPCSDA